MTAKVITIANQKGGVGKTTTAHALSGAFKKLGKRVLLIDLDAQANLSNTMNVDVEMEDIYEVMKGKIPVSEGIQKTEQGDIIPSSDSLYDVDSIFPPTKTGREHILKKAIEPIKNKYDFIIIDTQPTLGILTINALTTCDEVIVPACADSYSLQGLAQLYETIESVKEYTNPRIKIKGLLMTKFNKRTNLGRELNNIFNEKAKEIGTKVFKTKISQGIAISESQFLQESVFDTDSKPSQDYLKLAKEYLGREK